MDDEQLAIGILLACHMEPLSEEVIHRRALREEKRCLSGTLLQVVAEEDSRSLVVEDEAVLMQRSGAGRRGQVVEVLSNLLKEWLCHGVLDEEMSVTKKSPPPPSVDEERRTLR